MPKRSTGKTAKKKDNAQIVTHAGKSGELHDGTLPIRMDVLDSARTIISSRLAAMGGGLTYSDFALTTNELARLNAAEQMELLRELPFYQAAKLIERSDHPRELTQSLPPHELLYLINEIGDSGLELLLLATPQQMQSVLDIEAYRNDELDTDAYLMRLDQLISLKPDTADELLASLDPHTLVLSFLDHFRVLRKEWFEERNEINPDNYFTFDDEFAFEIIDPEDEHDTPHRVMNYLYKSNFELYRWVMEALINELPSELEEFCRREREGRLSEWGWPDYSFSMELLQRIPVEQVLSRIRNGAFRRDHKLTQEGPHLLPMVYQVRRTDRLFARSLARLEDEDRRGVHADLVHVVNRVIVARRCESNYEMVRDAVSWTRDLVSLGLDYLANSDEAAAADILRETSLVGLFSLGHNLMLRLRDRARDMLRRSFGHRIIPSLPLLSLAERDFMTGVTTDLPWLTKTMVPLDDDQLDPNVSLGGRRHTSANPSPSARSASSLHEYRQAETILNQIEGRWLFVFGVLKVDKAFFQPSHLEDLHPSTLAGVTFAHVGIASLILHILGETPPLGVRGLTRDDLLAFLQVVAPSGVLVPSAPQDLERFIASTLAELPPTQQQTVRQELMETFSVLRNELDSVLAATPPDIFALRTILIRSQLAQYQSP